MSYCHKESDTTLFIPTLILKYNSSACTVRTTINIPAWGKERKEKKESIVLRHGFECTKSV